MSKNTDIFKLISMLPENEYVRIGVETYEHTGEKALTAVHYIKAPEYGWPNSAAYFQHPPGSPRESQVDFPWKHDDTCVYGVSTPINKINQFKAWLKRDLTWRLKKLGILKEEDE